MRARWVPFLLASLPVAVQGQTSIGAGDVLERSIRYHDPSARWPTFARRLELHESRPNGEERVVYVSIDKPNERFVYERDDDGARIRAVLDRKQCAGSVNGETSTDQQATRYGLTCETITRRRNYYHYLYGLPMKLRDEGTIVAPEVTRTTFGERDALMILVTYEASVGSDTWRFYFVPTSYRLVGYSFNHDEALNDGEYITLEGEYQLDDMRLPMTRRWYRNKDGEYLGTDTIRGHARVSYEW